ncbi:hypothetical protein [Actinomyces haliotis]|uniref:hypothetical protein n=1 Tax=Actinomyces haliotis TaxID=1280843 RepID=UPI0018908AC5|nr:hypothetical protein [Actinomyces haliotis]
MRPTLPSSSLPPARVRVPAPWDGGGHLTRSQLTHPFWRIREGHSYQPPRPGRPGGCAAHHLVAGRRRSSLCLGVGVNGWPGASSTGKVLNGDVDDAAVYPTQLSAEQVAAHYKAATKTAVTPTPEPTATDAPTSAPSSSATPTDAGTPAVDAGGQDASVRASDSFDRTGAGAWGYAATGGAWAVSPATRFSVADGAGVIALDKAGSTSTATLTGVSSTSTTVDTTYTLSEAQTGGGVYTTVNARQTAVGSYGVKVRTTSTGSLLASLVKKVGSTETVLASSTVKGWSAGAPVHVSVTADGTGETSLAASVWLGDSAPAAPMMTATDGADGLQTAGSIGITEYLSGASTSTTGVMRLDELTATSAD